MAICTRHPFIQIFKPVLLMALDDYFADPAQEHLSRLFDAVNAMDIAHAPRLSRDEKLVMRVSERKDVFVEKFHIPDGGWTGGSGPGAGSKRPSQENTALHHGVEGGSSTSFDASAGSRARSRTDSVNSRDNTSVSSSWTGEDRESDSGLVGGQPHSHQSQSQMLTQTQQGWRSTETTSVSSHGMHNNGTAIPAILDPYSRGPKDTHFYSTSVVYRGHTLPIKMPLSTFPEEVGDVSTS